MTADTPTLRPVGLTPTHVRLNEILGCTTLKRARYDQIAAWIDKLVEERDEARKHARDLMADNAESDG
jgi:hypothetical protein